MIPKQSFFTRFSIFAALFTGFASTPSQAQEAQEAQEGVFPGNFLMEMLPAGQIIGDGVTSVTLYVTALDNTAMLDNDTNDDTTRTTEMQAEHQIAAPPALDAPMPQQDPSSSTSNPADMTIPWESFVAREELAEHHDDETWDTLGIAFRPTRRTMPVCSVLGEGRLWCCGEAEIGADMLRSMALNGELPK